MISYCNSFCFLTACSSRGSLFSPTNSLHLIVWLFHLVVFLKQAVAAWNISRSTCKVFSGRLSPRQETNVRLDYISHFSYRLLPYQDKLYPWNTFLRQYVPNSDDKMFVFFLNQIYTVNKAKHFHSFFYGLANQLVPFMLFPCKVKVLSIPCCLLSTTFSGALVVSCCYYVHV